MPENPHPSPACVPEFISELTGHQEVMRAFSISLLPGVADVDDILQRTNLVLWEKRSQFAAGTRFKSWALVVACWFSATISTKSRLRIVAAFSTAAQSP